MEHFCGYVALAIGSLPFVFCTLVPFVDVSKLPKERER
jgi:hypothetical protein